MLTTLVLLITMLLPQDITVEPILTEAIIDAPLADVWRAFTTKEGIESWMVASGDIDLHIGGRQRTSYTKGADLDGDTAIHQDILAIDPERMMAMRVVKPPKGFPFPHAIANTWTVIYFESIDAAHTRVIARMLGYTSDEESVKMRAFFETGNRATMRSLAKRFAVR
jgi:uncharacterized protein YndB with AHSA1/START domain